MAVDEEGIADDAIPRVPADDRMLPRTEANVKREARHILSLTVGGGDKAERDEESACLAASRGRELPPGTPARDSMTGRVLDRGLVAIARKKGSTTSWP